MLGQTWRGWRCGIPGTPPGERWGAAGPFMRELLSIASNLPTPILFARRPALAMHVQVSPAVASLPFTNLVQQLKRCVDERRREPGGLCGEGGAGSMPLEWLKSAICL
jgi:hypothetical protein